MNKIKELLSGMFAIVIGAYLLITYLFGMYNLAANDAYSAKELIAGGAFFPYANYIGTKEIYNSFSKDTYQNDEDIDFIIKDEKQSLNDFVASLNKTINPPVMVDEVTKILSITTDGKDIIYTYKIVDREVTEDIKIILKGMFVATRLQYCRDEEYNKYNQKIIEKDIGMSIIYLDKNNIEIAKASVSKSSCKD